MIYLTPELKVALGNQNSFKELMATKGEVFSIGNGRKTMKFSRNGEDFFIKVHTGVGWKEIFKELTQGKRPVLGARNEWQAIQYLPQIGVNTMSMAGYGLEGTNPARLQSFVVTNALQNVCSLETLCRDWQQLPPPVKFKRQLIRQVAKLARNLHQNGFIHRDFYICHILLQEGTGQLFLIDLHRAQIRKKIPRRWLVKELGSLYFSSLAIGLTHRDKLRFLKDYYQSSLRDILVRCSRLLREIETRAVRLQRKEAKKK